MAEAVSTPLFVESRHRSVVRTADPWSVIRTLGSLKAGVTLLVLIGVSMAAASIYEARHGRVAAQVLFYRAWWFNGLLLALAGNIFCATLVRWTISWRKLGFLITHIGVLVVLAGALLTSRFGIEGQLRLEERGMSDAISIPRLVIGIERLGENAPATEVDLPMSGIRPRAGLGRALSATGLDLSLVVDEFLPNARWTRSFEPSATGLAAVEVAVAGDGADPRMSSWLTPRSPSLRLGSVQIELAGPDSPPLPDLPPASTSIASSRGTLTLQVGGSTTVVDVTSSIGKPVSLGASGLSVRITAYHADAVVGPNRTLSSRGDQPNNPAIEFEIVGPQGSERRLAFAQFPEFASMHARTAVYPQVQNAYAADAIDRAPLVRFVPRPGGLEYEVRSTDGRVVRGPVRTDAPIAVQSLTLPLAVRTYLPAAREVFAPSEIARGEEGAETPATHVTFRAGGSQATHWLGWNRPAVVEVGGRSYRLTLRNREYRLPFSVQLEKFERETYPGTNQAAMFASHVTVRDSARSEPLRRTIQMNQPLRYGGYTFFQSGFEQRGSLSASILTVSRDPGKWTVYGGFLFVTAGVVWMIIAKRLGRPGGSPARRESAT
ncbi:MAG: cytochrome c biogenesis protein ResB [Phycisphaerae bacterium]|nr:cytochrome c biogenesis protein ResB [Phycisphaerae bacterium]